MAAKKHTLADNYWIEEITREGTVDECIRALASKQVKGYRTKIITSGNVVEVECYPIWTTQKAKSRLPKQNKSRLEQMNLNRKNAQKKCIRLINANFTKNNLEGTFTYDQANLPADAKAADKEFSKFLRKLRREHAKLSKDPFKFIFTTEFDNGKKGIRIHHHIVTNFPDRNRMEELWHGGAITRTRRLQPDDMGLTALAMYITKAKGITKCYHASRNLTKPTIIRKDNLVTRRKADHIFRGIVSAKDFFEKMIKGHIFKTEKYFVSDYTAGIYISIQMVKK